MQVGLVGLPRVGKTTIFSALVGQRIERSYGKRETHYGVAKVPDTRLPKLSQIYNPKREIYATVEFVDVGGLESGTGKKGYEEDFLKALSQTNALALVVRGFEGEDGLPPNPVREFNIAEEEFLLNDLGIIEKRIEKLQVQLKKMQNPQFNVELKLLEKCKEVLDQNQPLRTLTFTNEEDKLLRGFQFLSYKPLLVILNLSEFYFHQAEEWEKQIQSELTIRSEFLALQGELEREISELEEADRDLFLEELGIHEPASHKVIRTCYHLLDYITFFTVGEEECRAWTIKRNTTAVGAAATIHSDLARGFIRAEVSRCEDLLQHQSMHLLKEKGLVRLEGKNYLVQDGDVLFIRFAI
ncbi:MAG: redox-regulated ATPase YchF [bacterium]|nr:redox-regulated ATPase YchF [bacterium]